MPRDGAITFRDKCGRRGSYPLDRLIEGYGIDAKLFDFEPEADCPRKIARNPIRRLRRPVPGSGEGGVRKAAQTIGGGRAGWALRRS